jgi:acyl transferase domain-containing protein
MIQQLNDDNTMTKIAVIGISGRFPGAADVDEFWQNLTQGVESVRWFTPEQLLANGVDAVRVRDPKFVPANAVVDNIDLFDAEYFGYSRREAEITDPQHRLLLECADEAMQQAGYYGMNCKGSIGVFVSSASSSYFQNNVLAHPDILDAVGMLQANIASEKSFVATKISYKLGLTGPSMTVDTACSSSLVAIHQACASLLSYESDLVLTGGVAIDSPQAVGHLHQAGGIASPDGHCRTFDASAAGTVRGYGAGIVVLKRLEDALADRDTVHAVILASAVNNDGRNKPGFTAASVDGQREVISAVHALAGIDAASIGYIEAHGTGTVLGDPVEVQALTQAFRLSTGQRGYCGLGSVKTNLGHLDIAAGVTGFIKTVLVLKHGLIPPTLHFQQANPKIAFAQSPFYVVEQLTAWPANLQPRRAGVSSFGIGGTNAHVLLEQAPDPQPEHIAAPEQSQVLLLAAHQPQALTEMCERYQHYFSTAAERTLTAAAYTLRHGRQHFPCRAAVVARDSAEAAQQLAAGHFVTGHAAGTEPCLVFLFAGQGAQKIGMMLDVYRHQPVFASRLNHCDSVIRQLAGWSLTELLYPDPDQRAECEARLNLTRYTQPALFCVEYALACLLESFAVVPQLMLGHSLGEYVAATIAGVFSLEDALRLVIRRAELMQAMPEGVMLAVPLSERALAAYMLPGLDIAAVNAPESTVVAGPAEVIAQLRQTLLQAQIHSQLLNTSHAFHSAMMDPVLEPFAAVLQSVQLHAPTIPFISNLTGRLITAEQATSAAYWQAHLRGTVRFADGMTVLADYTDVICLEVAPGYSLTATAMRNGVAANKAVALLSNRGVQLAEHDLMKLQLGKLWCEGVSLDWDRILPLSQRRVPLPAYPYQKQSYWLSDKEHDNPEVQPLPLQLPDWVSQPLPSPSVPCQGRLLLVNSALPSTVWAEFCVGAEIQLTSAEQAVQQAPDYVLWFAEVTDSPVQQLQTFVQWIQSWYAVANSQPCRLLLCLSELLPATAAAMLAAAALVAQKEFSTLRASVLTCHGQPEVAAVMTELLHGDAGLRVRLDPAGRAVQQLIQPELTICPSRLRQGATYLLTGGCGGVGRVLARYLAEKYQAKLVLLGRSKPELCQQLLQQLLQAGADKATYHQVDLADATSLAQVLSNYQIDGLIHAAGIYTDSSWLFKSAADVADSMRAKVQGLDNLHRCLDLPSLDFALLCSSAGVFCGVPFQVDYLAANAYLDGVAQQMAGQGHVISVRWGMWRETATALQQAEQGGAEVRHNLSLGFTNQQGLQAFEQVLMAEPQSWIVATIAQSAFLAGLNQPQQPDCPASVNKCYSKAEIEQGLQQIWHTLLGTEPASPMASFFGLGGDSLSIVQQGKLIKNAFGVDLSAVELFNNPTIGKLTDTLYHKLQPAIETATPDTAVAASTDSAQDIAVVGMALRVPGAVTLDDFWHILAQGLDQVQSYSVEQLLQLGVSPDRLADPCYVKSGYEFALLDQFDAQFFNLTPKEAELTDPQQRMLLECAHEALQQAGLEGNQTQRIGVYAGTAMSSYLLSQILPGQDLTGQSMVDSLQIQTGNSQDYAATQLAYRLGLCGPAINVNTACSSSLVAIHLACQALRQGDCELALAGGASIRVPNSLGYQYATGSVESASGRCRPFDHQADGTIMSSGAAVVALRPLAAALRAGDLIYGVIKGSAVNNDGNHKVSFAAPSPVGQQQVVRAALNNAGVDSASISYIEAHGTGTKMGDPIELEALKGAMAVDGLPCLIGSVKSNLGHLDTAAGVVGLIKTLLMMQQRQLVPVANFSAYNPLLAIENSRFDICRELQSWPAVNGPRRAGVSSFGIGGSNAHVIVEQAPELPPAPVVNVPGQLLLFSANDADTLTLWAEQVATTLSDSSPARLAAVAWTLATRRQHREHRQFIYLQQGSQAVGKMRQQQFTGQCHTTQTDVVYVIRPLTPSQLQRLAELQHSLSPFRQHLQQFAQAADLSTETLSGTDALSAFALHYALLRTLSGWLPLKITSEHTAGELLIRALDSSTLAELLSQWRSEESGAQQTETTADSQVCSLVVGGTHIPLDWTHYSTGYEVLLTLIGQLWLRGCVVRWPEFWQQTMQAAVLPAYPYQRQSYWFGRRAALRNNKVQAQQYKTRPLGLSASYVAPVNQIQLQVTTLWQEVLSIAPVGIEDDFFQLGGHSLMVTELIARIRQTFEVELSSVELFSLLTPGRMAEHLLQRQIEGVDPVLLAQLMADEGVEPGL